MSAAPARPKCQKPRKRVVPIIRPSEGEGPRWRPNGVRTASVCHPPIRGVTPRRSRDVRQRVVSGYPRSQGDEPLMKRLTGALARVARRTSGFIGWAGSATYPGCAAHRRNRPSLTCRVGSSRSLTSESSRARAAGGGRVLVRARRANGSAEPRPVHTRYPGAVRRAGVREELDLIRSRGQHSSVGCLAPQPKSPPSGKALPHSTSPRCTRNPGAQIRAQKQRASQSRGPKLLPRIEAPAGIEPANSGFADRCLTTWLRRLGSA